MSDTPADAGKDDLEIIERKAFEEAAFAQYYVSGIRRTDNPFANLVQIHFEPTAQLTAQEFLARGEDGTYKEQTLNPAWWAWKTRAEQSARLRSHAELERVAERALNVMQFHAGRCPLHPNTNYSGCEEHLAEYRAVVAALAAYRKGGEANDR